MILRGLKKVFFYHYNIFFIKSQFSGFFWAIWEGARSIRNFAYGYTDRDFGPGRPTPARPAPPLLYHKPQALSIGILHKKFGQIFLPENFNHNLRNHHLHPTLMRNHHNHEMGLPAYTYKAEDRLCSKDNPNHLQGNDNVSFFFLLRFVVVFIGNGSIRVCLSPSPFCNYKILHFRDKINRQNAQTFRSKIVELTY